MAFVNDHLSYSRASRFEQCPKSFAFHYIDKLPATPGPEQRFGKIVHATCEALVREHVAAGRAEQLSMPRALAIFRATWAQDGLSPVALFEEGVDIVKQFVRREGIVDPRDVVAIEQPFELAVGRFKVVGAIDRADRVDDFAVRIRDYKTNRMLFTREEVDSHLQLSLYHAAAQQLFPWAKTIELQFDMLRHGVALKTSRTPEQIDAALAYLEAIGEATERAASYPARLGPNCVRCDHREHCDGYADALQGKRHVVAKDMNDLLAVAAEREEVARLASILYRRKQELEDILKTRLEETDRLELGGVRYQMQSAASVEYPVEPTLAALSEATGMTREKLHDKLVVIDNSALDALLKQVAEKLPRPRVTLLRAELKARGQTTFVQRFSAKPMPGGHANPG